MTETNPTPENDRTPDRPEGSDAAPEGAPADALVSEDGIVVGGDAEFQKAVTAALRTCYDPEIPVDIYELGLIYRVEISPTKGVEVDMTLTSPNCPVAESLPNEVRQVVESVAGVAACRVDVVWDPPWGPEKMSEAARLSLGMF